MKSDKSFIFLTVILIICFCLTLSNVFASNSAAVDSNIKYRAIKVSTGDSVWGIASKCVSNKEDIRDTIMLIKEINHLDNNVQIYPGQILKVPDTYKVR